MHFNPALYLVTDRTHLNGKNFLAIIEEAINAGVTMVQLREKNTSTREFYELALQLKSLTTQYDIPLWINDRIDVAIAAKADGVHLGQSDMPADVARRIVPSGMLIGVSASTVEQAVKAEKDGADCIGTGAVFPTSTKGDATPVTESTLFAIKSAVSIPVVAIGGINVSNVAAPMACGIDGIAVSSAIMYADSPSDTARQLRRAVENAERHA